MFNGNRVGVDINPNSYPAHLREQQAKLLCAEVYKHLNNGGLFREYKQEEVVTGKLTDAEYLQLALKRKLKGDFSESYKRGLSSILVY